MPLGGWEGTRRDLFTCRERAATAGADKAALAVARRRGSEQDEGCCLPSSPPGDQGALGATSCQGVVRGSFSLEGIRTLEGWEKKGDAALTGRTGVPKRAESSTASERGKIKLFLGKRQRREYGEIKLDSVTRDRRDRKSGLAVASAAGRGLHLKKHLGKSFLQGGVGGTVGSLRRGSSGCV